MAIHRKQTPACPIELTMNVIAARWKAMILYHLMQQRELRYGQIRQRLDGIADRVLTTQLKELVADGAIQAVRRGRHVVYALTVQGQELAPVFEAMLRWGQARQAEQAPAMPRDIPVRQQSPRQNHLS